MEISLINILIWILLFFLGLLIAVYLHTTKHFGTLEALGIPCEKPWPFFGNMAPEIYSYLHEHDMEVYKKYGRIYGHYEGRHPTIRITDPEILREVLVKQFQNFADRRHFESFTDPVVNKFLSIMRGDEWKQKRNVLSPAFTSGKLKQMTPLIEKCSIPLMKLIEEKSRKGESFEAKQTFSIYLTDVIASCAFGLDMNVQEKDGEKFLKYARELVAGQSVFTFLFLINTPAFAMKYIFFPIMKHFSLGLEFFKKISYDVIKIRQANNERRNDFLQIMLDCAKDEGGDETNQSKESSVAEDEANGIYKPTSKKILTEDDVVANALLFLFAGFETSSTTLAFVAYALATNQECQDRLLDELDNVLEKSEGKLTHDVVGQLQYMEMVIMETLRFYPPMLRFDRQCLTTTKINDLVIPKGTVVVIPLYPLHYDEEFYPEPHIFDPERFSPENKDKRNQYTFFGFGIGPRNCIGMRFALLELKLTLAIVLRKHRFICGPKTQVPMKFQKSQAMLLPEEGFNLYIEKRSSSSSTQ